MRPNDERLKMTTDLKTNGYYLTSFYFENGGSKKSFLNLAELQHSFVNSSQMVSNILQSETYTWTRWN